MSVNQLPKELTFNHLIHPSDEENQRIISQLSDYHFQNGTYLPRLDADEADDLSAYATQLSVIAGAGERGNPGVERMSEAVFFACQTAVALKAYATMPDIIKNRIPEIIEFDEDSKFKIIEELSSIYIGRNYRLESHIRAHADTLAIPDIDDSTIRSSRPFVVAAFTLLQIEFEHAYTYFQFEQQFDT